MNLYAKQADSLQAVGKVKELWQDVIQGGEMHISQQKLLIQ